MKVVLLLMLAMLVPLASSLRHEDAVVTNLPGLTHPLTFQHYAGHLELAAGEKLFYWYTESQESPEKDPIVLWLNGGPGCSSLGGLFTENGPFVVRDDLSIKLNRYSWNRKVNMVWLESPAGVGFSGNVEGPNYYHDDVVAAKTREFLALFFNKFSELKHREFYITGESYAGMYIPYLVDRLVAEPLDGVNLKGFAIGNPFTDNLIDNNAYIDYYYSHAMVSLEAYETIKVQCGAHIGCLFNGTPCPAGCEALLQEAEAGATANGLNPYYIYGDVCLMDNSQAKALRKRAKPSARSSPTHRGDIGVCADSLTHLYLNRVDVQNAIHVTESTEDKGVEWTGCSDPVGNFYTSSPSSLPKYHTLLSSNLSTLIYSGDADSVVNFIGTERWIGGQGLKLRITEKWHAWFGPDHQLAGYVQMYQGLTFKTVKGAGHMVPAVRPLHGLHLFQCFVFGEHACKHFVYPLDDDEIEAGMTTVEKATLNLDNSTGTTIWSIMVLVSGVILLVAVGYRNGRNRTRYASGYQGVA